MRRKLSDKELMKRKFRKFLSDNDCLLEWEENVRKHHFAHRTDANSARKIFANLSPMSWISSAFAWNETKQGFNYWSNVSANWEP